jgi:16S rRNA (guanine527-N7)-methyltransferase
VLRRYAVLLREWNGRVNLISRGDIDRVLSYHVIDSVAVQHLIAPGALVCDLGSGAGLPGIPLSIVRPDLSVVLVESSRKRGLFLRTAIAELNLDRVRLLNDRAEQLAPLGCDVVTSRLTGDLDDVLASASPHIRPGGRLVLYKTRACRPELERTAGQVQRLGLAAAEVSDVPLPFSGITRRFVVLTRTA